MKKIFGFIAMAIIFVGAVTFTSCEKQIINDTENTQVQVEEIKNPIQFIKDHSVVVEKLNRKGLQGEVYDFYSQKVLIVEEDNQKQNDDIIRPTGGLHIICGGFWHYSIECIPPADNCAETNAYWIIWKN